MIQPIATNKDRLSLLTIKRRSLLTIKRTLNSASPEVELSKTPNQRQARRRGGSALASWRSTWKNVWTHFHWLFLLKTELNHFFSVEAPTLAYAADGPSTRR